MNNKSIKKIFFIDKDLVKNFAKISGDMNPIHLSEDYAANTIFKKPIAHGMLLGSLISNVLANDFPGEGSIYLSQNLTFKKPIFLDTEVEIQLSLQEIIEKKSIAIIKTDVYVGDVCVIEGNATVQNKNVF